MMATTTPLAPGVSQDTSFAQLLAGIQASGGGGYASAEDERNARPTWGSQLTPSNSTSIEAQRYAAAGLGTAASYMSTYADEVMAWYAWPESRRRAVAQMMADAGLIESSSNYVQARAVWQDAVEEASQYTAMGKQVSPMEMLNIMGGLRESRGGTTTQTSRSTTEVSRAAARQSIRAIYQDQLGRDPTEDEMSRYTAMIQGQARSNPTVSTTTTTTDGSGNTTSDTKTTPGYGLDDAQEATRSKVEQNPEYGAFQAATTYFNVLENVVGSLG